MKEREPLDLPTLAKDFAWTAMGTWAGDAVERATGRPVRVVAPTTPSFVRRLEQRAVFERLRTLDDPRVLPVLCWDPWIVVVGESTVLPLEGVFDAAIELAEVAQRLASHGISAGSTYAGHVEGEVRVSIAPSYERPTEWSAFDAKSWVSRALADVPNAEPQRREIEAHHASGMKEQLLFLARWGSPAGAARAERFVERPAGRPPLPDFDEARRHGEALLALDPTDVFVAVPLGAVHHHLGCVAFAHGDREEACRLLDRAVELCPDLEVRTSRALVARAMGDEVLEGSLLALRADEEHWLPYAPRECVARWHFASASLAARRGVLDEALRHAEHALQALELASPQPWHDALHAFHATLVSGR